MKTYFLAFFLLVNYALLAQAGIHTQSPKATLHVVGKPGVTTSMDGIIAPKLTGNQLNNKTYTSQQDGALVYVTSPLTNVNKGQCAAVKAKGYYFFSTNKWNKVESDSKIATLTDVDVATKLPNTEANLIYNGTKWETNRHFFVEVSGTDSRTFSNSYVTYIPPTVTSDEFNSYNSTNGKITVPDSGLYMIDCRIRTSDHNPAGTNFMLGVRANNAGLKFHEWHAVNDTPNHTHRRTTLSISKIVKLNAGTTLELIVYVDDSTGIQLLHSNFQVYKLISL